MPDVLYLHSIARIELSNGIIRMLTGAPGIGPSIPSGLACTAVSTMTAYDVIKALHPISLIVSNHVAAFPCQLL